MIDTRVQPATAQKCACLRGSGLLLLLVPACSGEEPSRGQLRTNGDAEPRDASQATVLRDGAVPPGVETGGTAGDGRAPVCEESASPEAGADSSGDRDAAANLCVVEVSAGYDLTCARTGDGTFRVGVAMT
jgi:hypothetical protein